MSQSADLRTAQFWSRVMPIVIIAVTIAAFGAISSIRAESVGSAGTVRGLDTKPQSVGIGPKSN